MVHPQDRKKSFAFSIYAVQQYYKVQFYVRVSFNSSKITRHTNIKLDKIDLHPDRGSYGVDDVIIKENFILICIFESQKATVGLKECLCQTSQIQKILRL